MANRVINGPYGWYFSYTDEAGKKKNLSIFKEVYENYFAPGYMTEDHLEQLVTGKTVTFTTPKKSGSGVVTVTAKLIPYTRKDGKETRIIDIQTDLADDDVTIKAKGKALLESYYDGTRFSYTRPQNLIKTFDLSTEWRTYAQDFRCGTDWVFYVKCYRPFVRNDAGYTFYGKLANGRVEEIDEGQFNKIQADYKAKREQEQAEFDRKSKESDEVKNELLKWIKDIESKIWTSGSTVSTAQLIENADKFLTVSVPNLEDRVAGMLNSNASYKLKLSDYFDSAKNEVKRNITMANYTDASIGEDIKNRLLNNIKTYVEYSRVIEFRNKMFKEYQSTGLEAMTILVDVDNALSLGYFPTVQRALTKYKQDAPRYIIYNMYREIIDLKILEEHLLNMLKIYYDFYDMPEKDRKSIAKYVAQHKLSDYYDKVRDWDEVLEILIDNSRDPRLTKPLLEGIAGTSKANVLKNKTYYFEKRGRLRNNILLYKPIELVEELRKHIKEFNASSGVAILTNIELDADESFVFQFYTFADAEGDEKGFDGRRMLNLTRIYNRGKDKDHKIGFYFDNESEEDDNDDNE